MRRAIHWPTRCATLYRELYRKHIIGKLSLRANSTTERHPKTLRFPTHALRKTFFLSGCMFRSQHSLRQSAMFPDILLIRADWPRLPESRVTRSHWIHCWPCHHAAVLSVVSCSCVSRRLWVRWLDGTTNAQRSARACLLFTVAERKIARRDERDKHVTNAY